MMEGRVKTPPVDELVVMDDEKYHVKAEQETGTEVVDIKLDVKELFSTNSPLRRPPTPPLPLEASTSRSPSPAKPTISRSLSKKKIKTPPPPPQLIDDLPAAWDAAHETFDTLERCVYERKDLGQSHEQDEMMVCDCVFDKHDPDAQPCSEHSDCINRALYIECLANECRAKTQCQNQRFTKRQYAPVDIVQTELKGFGLRAMNDITSGSLIYEYIGEVITEKTFRKRMQQYGEEGIRHFYFMMLQKEEYIDATKKGGIGRFANHSCNPNSEVQKWVVGRRLRMGIFTKRDVVKGEEITFNYNVDRYGHDAQICYCGEPNCVGTIGGKTQTDIGTMNDLFLDALGISEEVEELQLKGSKKKKSRQLDEDFIPVLRPIEEPEVQKVAAAMRQSSENGKMMSRLLERINLTEDMAVHRQLMRMHGFGLMNMVLTQLSDQRDTVLLALRCMKQWRLQIRNKIDDSNIEEPVRALKDSGDEEVKALAQELLDHWSTLETSYKIPRKSKITSLDEEDEKDTTTIAEANTFNSAGHRRPQAWENTQSIELVVAPVRPRAPLPTFPRSRPLPVRPTASSERASVLNERSKLDAIIALAQQTQAQAQVAQAPEASPVAESSRSGSRTIEDDDRRKRQRTDRPEDEAKKEKRLTKLVGDFVVRSMSKYKAQMEHDTFKRYAKECTMILVEKEKKGHSYSTTRHPTLSEEKKAKMKSFVKEYTHKVLKKLKEKGKLKRQTTNDLSTPTSTPALSTPLTMSTPSGNLATPNGHSDDHEDLVDDIFGADDVDMDIDEPRSPSPVKVTKVNGTNGFSSMKVDSFRPTRTPRTPPLNGGPSPEKSADAAVGQ